MCLNGILLVVNTAVLTLVSKKKKNNTKFSRSKS